jgi:aspartate/tyrosine/aromatic aminotransferase
MVLFKNLILYPVDPIFGLQQEYEADSRDSKISLIVGVFLSEDLKPYILPSVKRAEKRLLEEETSKNYLPIAGDPTFRDHCERLVFSKELSDCIAVQTVGGTGALAVGARLLKAAGKELVGISSPSWLNHSSIFEGAGYTVHEYPYYSYEKKRLDFEAMMTALDHLPVGSVLLLQPSCQNPTGNDLTTPQWEELFEKIEERDFCPFFDCAYQGFGRGLDEDVAPIREMAKRGRPFLVALSQSKNFGLYCERTGALLVFDPEHAYHEPTFSNTNAYIRSIHSNSPAHGARIVNQLLSKDEYRKEWEADLKEMRERIQSMRGALCDQLDLLYQDTDHPFSFIRNQVGMFSYTGLEKGQVLRLREEKGIFMPLSGRINVAGMNKEIIPRIAKAFVEVSQ